MSDGLQRFGDNMDIKDAIFSTLAELESTQELEITQPEQKQAEEKKQSMPYQPQVSQESAPRQSTTIDEVEYLKSVRERLLVLFEGLQAPNNRNLEKKIEISINFMEFLLATIEERLSKLK